MINLKKSSRRNMQKLIYALPIMITICFAVYPVHAVISNKKYSFSTWQLTEFEGYYHADNDPNLFLQIMVKNNKLVLKQLWDDREIVFEQKSALYFYNDEHSFPLTFSKGANGEITQVLAFERDTWIKVKDYKPLVKKEIVLSPEKMQAFGGKYRRENDGNEAFLQFTIKGNSIEVKELWSDKLFTIVPESELVFFGKGAYYPVQFSKDKDGNVNQALIYNRDTWVKVKEQ
jgi:uncharacterized protein YjhX (UPF0386 family)